MLEQCPPVRMIRTIMRKRDTGAANVSLIGETGRLHWIEARLKFPLRQRQIQRQRQRQRRRKKRQTQLLKQRQNVSLIGGTRLRWILGKFEVSSTQTWRIRDSSSGSYPPIRPHVYLCLKRHTNYKIYLNLKQWHYLIHSKISHTGTAWCEGNVICKK